MAGSRGCSLVTDSRVGSTYHYPRCVRASGPGGPRCRRASSFRKHFPSPRKGGSSKSCFPLRWVYNVVFGLRLTPSHTLLANGDASRICLPYSDVFSRLSSGGMDVTSFPACSAPALGYEQPTAELRPSDLRDPDPSPPVPYRRGSLAWRDWVSRLGTPPPAAPLGVEYNKKHQRRKSISG